MIFPYSNINLFIKQLIKKRIP